MSRSPASATRQTRSTREGIQNSGIPDVVYLPEQEKLINRTRLFYNTVRALTRNPNDVDNLYASLRDFSQEGSTEEKDIPYEKLSADGRLRLTAYQLASIQLIPAHSDFISTKENLERTAATERAISLDIANLSGQEREHVWTYYKNITQRFYTELEASIHHTEFLAFREAINYTIRFAITDKGEEIKRELTLGIFSGDVLSGKDSSAHNNHIDAIATGTEGILGRGDGYDHWETAMLPFDYLRANEAQYPDKLITIAIGLQIGERRQELDLRGEYHTPLWFSGFPRTPAQAEMFFFNIDPKTIAGAIYLKIATKKVSIERTIFRIFEDFLKTGTIREDDKRSLQVGNSEQFLKDLEERIERDIKPSIKPPYDTKEAKMHIMEAKLTYFRPLVEEWIRSKTVDLDPSARWYRDCDKRENIIKILEGLGIHVDVIEVDTLTPQEQSVRVAEKLRHVKNTK